MPNTREKLIELICSTKYGNGSLIGKNFQKGFVEKIADHLIANGVTVQKWIPVTDKKPNKKGTYLVCTDNFGIVLAHWYGERFGGGYASKHITHWMPLPEPQKGE